jgi:XTP/dITP diphosphohydrolase
LKSQPSLLIATGNEGKVQEFRHLLTELPFVLLGLGDFPAIQSVAETGSTFIENASLKASGYARQSQALTLADDSGLEVDALGGAPGVMSARFAGDTASDGARIERLLTELSRVEGAERSARFVCAIVIADRTGAILSISTGICEGHIAVGPRGKGGFGYDPVFIPAAHRLTFGELKPDIKNQISHRARALKAARHYLQGLTIASGGR